MTSPRAASHGALNKKGGFYNESKAFRKENL